MSDWEKLYTAAGKFQKAAPWNWMGNDDLFAVESPDSGEMGYCSIMGSGGEEFGILVFLGEKGYRRYLDIMNSEGDDPENFENTVMTPQLSYSYGSRKEMEKEDLAVINALALKFRGAMAWPIFRSHKPGYYPWFLDKEEIHFMTAIIERSLVVSEQVKNNELDLFEREEEGQVLTCRLLDNEWIEEWRTASLPAPKPTPADRELSPVKEAELLLLRNSKGKAEGNWEMDIFMMALPIGVTTERPHFPLCFLAVDRKVGLILGVEMTEPWISTAEKRENILKMIRNAPAIPATIQVKSARIKEIIEPLSRNLGIKITIGKTSFLEKARGEIEGHLEQSLMRK